LSQQSHLVFIPLMSISGWQIPKAHFLLTLQMQQVAAPRLLQLKEVKLCTLH